MKASARVRPSAGRRAAALAAAIVAVGLVALSADTVLTKTESDSLARKIQLITDNGASGRSQARLTPVSEREVNAYLRFELRDKIPAGIAEPSVSILGEGRVSATATVDLDAYKAQRKSTGWLDPTNLLMGKLPVAAEGVLQTAAGSGRFALQSASISGVPVPKAVLQELVTYYSRSPQNPQGVNLDAPFELPARILEIRVGQGSAVVVQ